MDQNTTTLLELIRIDGIVKMLLDTVGLDDLKKSLCEVLNIVNDNAKAELLRLNRYQLISLVSYHACRITHDVITHYYEQYRYGLKPGFSLYLLTGVQPTITIADVYSQLRGGLNEIPDYPDSAIRHIHCKGFCMLADSIAELSLSYLKKHSYIDENENPRFIHEFNEFFIWINVNDGYMAVGNVHDRIISTILALLKEILQMNISGVKLTNPVIEKVFGKSQRKGRYIKTNASNAEPEKIMISDSHLYEKENVLDSVESYDMVSTNLDQSMDDGSINTLGINCDKGKLYLSKNTTATLFREWSISAIQKIVPLITDNASMSDFQIFRSRNIISTKEWKCTKSQALIIEHIVYGVIRCLQTRNHVAYININAFEIWQATDVYWLPKHVCECNECGDKTFLYCSQCRKSAMRISKRGELYCTNCRQYSTVYECDEGHRIEIKNPADTLLLVPTAQTLEIITRILRDELLIPFNNTFQISDNRVEIYPLSAVHFASIEEIPELASIAEIELSKEEYNNLWSELEIIKEKCKATKTDACNTCLMTNTRQCLMKVFTTHSEYRPSPHNGHEFADVSFPVTMNGKKIALVGVVKSALTRGASLTRASASARDMFQQVFAMSQDARVGIIAAICPSRFQDQFIADLNYLSRLTKKPIVVLDDIFMCKQLRAFKSMLHE